MQQLDFQSRSARSPQSSVRWFSKLPFLVIVIATILTLSAISSLAFITRTDRQDLTLNSGPAEGITPVSIKKEQESNRIEDKLHVELNLPQTKTHTAPSATAAAAVPQTQPANYTELVVHSGDSLSSLLNPQGISPQTIYRLVNSSSLTKGLSNMRPGQKLRLFKDAQGQLVQLQYLKNLEETLQVDLQNDGSYTSRVLHSPLEARPVYRSGIIEDSLFVAASKHQVPEEIIMQLVSIFGWDIDFALDIRRGDSFTVIYEDLFKDNQRVRSGKILAAEFINQGQSIRAVRYTNPDGDANYFSPEGLSMRKAFLRSPVKFSRISSGFSKARWHPVLGKWRSHKGVDYAASRGTPVRASGDGKVIHVGTKGGYGKTVILAHGGKYSTLYAHLSRYATNMYKGKKIKQGQVIGYVGKTGLATGPHLHYEFRVNGVHRNPLTVKLPAAEPVASHLKPDFNKQTEDLIAQLEVLHNTLLATLDQ